MFQRLDQLSTGTMYILTGQAGAGKSHLAASARRSGTIWVLDTEGASQSLLGKPGIYVAPTGRHLTINGRMIRLADDPPVSGHRPSATVLFRSVAREYGPAAVGVLLTGMGEDGAAGLHELKRAGGVTIAQDEASSVVFGMPAVAISRGIVDHVLPPVRIAALLLDLARTERGGEG